VYAASERQYTAAREVQVPRGGMYVWRKAERQELDTRIGKANAVVSELYRSVDKKGASKHRKAVSFYIGLCWSLPMAMVMNLGLWPKEY